MSLQLKFCIHICPLVSTGISWRYCGCANSASDYHRKVDVIKSESYIFFSSLVYIILQSVRFEIALWLQETDIFIKNTLLLRKSNSSLGINHIIITLLI